MLSIVGEQESVHAKFEAYITLRYVQRPLQTYIEKNRQFRQLGGLALLMN